MSAFFRLLIIAGLSATLLVACGEKEPKVEEALDSAQTHTEAAASEAKNAAAEAVEAAKDAAAAAKAQISATTAAAEKAVENK
jgi:outer membrane murein-binding lipoprotein Lpp